MGFNEWKTLQFVVKFKTYQFDSKSVFSPLKLQTCYMKEYMVWVSPSICNFFMKSFIKTVRGVYEKISLLWVFWPYIKTK